MPRAGWERDLTDATTGALITGPVQVTLRNELTGVRPQLYADYPDDAASIGNPATFPNGRVKVHPLEGGWYRIDATGPNGWELNPPLRHVGIGLAQGSDGVSLQFDEQVDTIGDLDDWDAEEAGFVVLVSDIGDGRAALYTLLTPGTPGTWSAPAYVTGADGPPGADGNDGAPGADGTDGAPGADGDKGWAPAFAVATSGANRVLQLVDYVGGTGDKPTDNIGDYVGASGYVSTVGDAINIRGATGATGAAGRSAGYRWLWNILTSGSPGTGYIAANAALASATELRISETDTDSANRAALFGLWSATDNPVKGHIRLEVDGAASVYALYEVTGAGTDMGVYWSFPVSYVGHSGSFGSSQGIIAVFTPAGAEGAAKAPDYTVATVPSAATAGVGAMIYVSDETGGAVIAFSDGTDWRRVTDRAVIS